MIFRLFNQGLYFPFHRVYISNDGKFVAWILGRFDSSAELYIEVYDGVRAVTAYVPFEHWDSLEYFNYGGSRFCSMKSRIACYDDISRLISK